MADRADGNDQRLLINAPEFSQILKVASRAGDTTDAMIRRAWESGHFWLNRARSKDSVEVRNAHVSIVSHITPEELRPLLGQVDIANGFAGRFLWAHVKRPRKVALPPTPDFEEIGEALKRVIDRGKGWASSDSPDRPDLYERMYNQLPEGRGLQGAIVHRAAPQIVRLALCYMLFDGKAEAIQTGHLLAARALYQFVEQSVRNIFGDRTGNRLADRILVELRAGYPGVVAHSELNEALGGHLPGVALEDAVGLLVDMGFAERWRVSTKRRGHIDISATPW